MDGSEDDGPESDFKISLRLTLESTCTRVYTVPTLKRFRMVFNLRLLMVGMLGPKFLCLKFYMAPGHLTCITLHSHGQIFGPHKSLGNSPPQCAHTHLSPLQCAHTLSAETKSLMPSCALE